MDSDAVLAAGTSQRGSASVIAVLLLVAVVSFLLLVATDMAGSGAVDTTVQEAGVDALLVAESGLERAMYRFSASPAACAANGLGESNIELVAGSGRSFSLVSDATGLPALQCRLTVTGQVASGNASRSLRAIVSAGAAGIAVDGASNHARANQNAASWLHTVAGVNRLLLVGLSVRGSETTSAVSANGVPLTRAGVRLNAAAATYAEIWYLLNPAPGSNTLQVTFSGAVNVVAGALSLTGVDQLSPLSLPAAGAVGTSTSAAVTVANAVNNAYVLAVLAGAGGLAPVLGGTGVQQWSDFTGGFFTRVTGAGARFGPLSPAAPVTLSWTLNAAAAWAAVGVAVVPAAGGTASIISWSEIVP